MNTNILKKYIGYACISTIIVFSISTVAIYYNRQDVRTVYKPNADWRAATRYLEDEINAAPAVPEMFTVTSAEELTYYNPLFKQLANKELEFNPSNQELQDNFWLINEIKKHHLPKIYDKMVRDKKQRLYLIHNNYWSSGSKEIFDQLRADQRFENKAMQSFKGLDIYRFDLAQ